MEFLIPALLAIVFLIAIFIAIFIAIDYLLTNDEKEEVIAWEIYGLYIDGDICQKEFYQALEELKDD